MQFADNNCNYKKRYNFKKGLCDEKFNVKMGGGGLDAQRTNRYF
jgi:hypothetical protein